MAAQSADCHSSYTRRSCTSRWPCSSCAKGVSVREIPVTDSQSTDRGLLDIDTFIIEREVLNDTIRFLKEVGTTGAEGFVLWGGKPTGKGKFRFTTAVIPEQHAVMTEHGLLVFVH